MNRMKLNRRDIVKRLVFSILGVTSVSIGINLLLLSKLGLSPFDTLTYAVQDFFSLDKFGNAALLLHLFFLIGLAMIYKLNLKKTVTLTLNLLSVFLVTRVVNLFAFIINLDSDTSIKKSAFFVFGFLLYCFGAFLIAKGDLILPPFDKFVLEISKIKALSIGKARFIIDSLILLTVLMVFKNIDFPISLATLIITFGTGLIISVFEKIFPNS